MKTIKFTIALIAALCLFGVNNLSAQKLEGMTQKQLDDKYLKIYSTPEDKLTKEELGLKMRIAEMLVDNLVVVNNKLILKGVTKEDFAKKNIPEYYYYNIMTTIDGINKSVVEGKMSVETLNNSMVKSRVDYNERMATFKQKKML